MYCQTIRMINNATVFQENALYSAIPYVKGMREITLYIIQNIREKRHLRTSSEGYQSA